MTESAEAAQDPRALVLVTGSGRSGTSSLAGSLSKLGLHVPLPVLPPNEINPKGFFETAWVVKFHKQLLRRAIVRPSDGSPTAIGRMRDVLADGVAADELSSWLSAQSEPRIVVKDNQACWFLDLWRESAARLGADLSLLTSLRHPAEVVGSRDLVWGHGRDEDERRRRQTSNVAAWLNGILLTEAAGRQGTRAFVGYADLMTDWRTALGSVSEQLDLALPVPPVGRPHELDTWLDVGLQRSRLTWDDIRLPGPLRDLASSAWQHVGVLRETPHDAAAMAGLDDVRSAYDELYAASKAIAIDHSRYLARAAARKNSAKLRARWGRGR